MKLQYCSDLHLEFQGNKKFLKNFPIKPEGEMLLLAGDIVLFKMLKEHDAFFNCLPQRIISWISQPLAFLNC